MRKGDADMLKKLMFLITLLFIFSLQTVNAETALGIANSNNVPIQDKAGSMRVIDTINTGTVVNVLNSTDKFYEVEYNGIRGWASRSYIKTDAGGELEIHFIDPNSRVDAIFIRVGDKSMFIDGGFYRDAAVEIAYLKQLGVSKIDYYLGSHAHSNHVGAAGPIIQTFGIKTMLVGRQQYNGQNSTLYMMNKTAQNSGEKQAIAACEKRVVNVGDVIDINGLKITCVGPIKVSSCEPSSTSENANSLILRMDFGSRTFLFAGDTSASQLNAANSVSPGCIDVEIYKNSHHNGTLSSSTYKLISPAYVFFTTGPSSMPSTSYLNNIASTGAKYYIATNNAHKNVLLKTDGQNVQVIPNYIPGR